MKRLNYWYKNAVKIIAWCLMFWSLGEGLLHGFCSVVNPAAAKMPCEAACLLLSVWCAVLISCFRKKRKAALIGTVFAGVGYGLAFHRQVIGGWKAITAAVAFLWKRYYGLGGRKEMPDADTDATMAIVFIIVLFYVLETLFLLKKKLVPLAFAAPLFVVCLDLLIGYAPSGYAVFILAGGMMGLIVFRQAEGLRSPAAYLSIYGTLILAATLAFRYGDAVTAPFLAQHDRLLRSQREFEMNLKNGVYLPDIHRETGRVNNISVRYSEKEMLHIKAGEKPENPIYLRGYVGDIYEHGTWKQSDEEAAKEFLEKWDMTQTDHIYSMMAHLYEAMEPSKITPINLTVEYIGNKNKYAYLPYYGYDKEVQENFTKTGCNDTVFRSGQKKYEMEVYDVNYDKVYPYVSFAARQESSFLKDYDEYALANYHRGIPSGLDKLNALAEMMEEERYGSISVSTGEVSAEFYAYTAEEANESYHMAEIRYASSVNDKLGLVSLKRNIDAVGSTIHGMANYTKKPPVLPYGEDVTEYFLFESQQGYCTHFASAGTLLLQELGVPARYVTGYVVKADAFKEQEDGSYEASVPDSSEHAWAEVYLSAFGWVPVEMTPGYLSEGMLVYSTGIHAEDVADYLNGSNTAASRPEQDKTETAEESPEPEQSEEKKEEAKEKGSSNKNKREKAEGMNLGAYAAAAGRNKPAVIAMIISFFVVVCGACAGFRIKKRRKLWKSFRMKDTNQSVVNMAHYLYRELKRAGIARETNQTDSDFLQEIEGKLPEAVREPFRAFMKYLEKAQFSNERLSPEEVLKARRWMKEILDAGR